MNEIQVKEIIKDMIKSGEIQVNLHVPEYSHDYEWKVENGYDVKSVISEVYVELEISDEQD